MRETPTKKSKATGPKGEGKGEGGARETPTKKAKATGPKGTQGGGEGGRWGEAQQQRREKGEGKGGSTGDKPKQQRETKGVYLNQGMEKEIVAT